MYNYILVSTEIVLNINSPSWGRNRHQVKRQLMQRVRDPILPLALGFWNMKTAEFLVPKVWSWGELINVGRKEQFYNSLITISNHLRSKVGRDNSSWQNLWGHCNLRKETPVLSYRCKLPWLVACVCVCVCVCNSPKDRQQEIFLGETGASLSVPTVLLVEIRLHPPLFYFECSLRTHVRLSTRSASLDVSALFQWEGCQWPRGYCSVSMPRSWLPPSSSRTTTRGFLTSWTQWSWWLWTRGTVTSRPTWPLQMSSLERWDEPPPPLSMTLEHCHLLNGPPARRGLRTDDLVEFWIELHVFWLNYHSEASLTDHFPCKWELGKLMTKSSLSCLMLSLCFSTPLLTLPWRVPPQWAPLPLHFSWLWWSGSTIGSELGALSPPSFLAASACLLCLLLDQPPLWLPSLCVQQLLHPSAPSGLERVVAVLSGWPYSCPLLCR